MGLGATTSAARRVRRRWATLAAGAPARGEAAALQLALARGVCGTDASPRDVLALCGAVMDHDGMAAFIDRALATSSDADTDADANLDLDAEVDLDALEQLACAGVERPCDS